MARSASPRARRSAPISCPRCWRHLRAAHPEIEITIVATGQQSDLQLREADIAIRNAQPTQDDLIARRTPDRPAGLFARRDYLERLGG